MFITYDVTIFSLFAKLAKLEVAIELILRCADYPPRVIDIFNHKSEK